MKKLKNDSIYPGFIMPNPGLYPDPGLAPRQYAHWIFLHPHRRKEMLEKVPDALKSSVIHYLDDEIMAKKYLNNRLPKR